jgi:hypothetical protein
MAVQPRYRRSADDYADELKELIRRGFPDAEFNLQRRGAKEYDLDVYGDFEDTMPVEKLISDRPTNILLESGIHIHVIPLGRRHNSGS